MWFVWLILPFECLILMILTMAKYHKSLLKDSTLSLLCIVKFFSSLETKMIQKRPNETFLRDTLYLANLPMPHLVFSDWGLSRRHQVSYHKTYRNDKNTCWQKRIENIKFYDKDIFILSSQFSGFILNGASQKVEWMILLRNPGGSGPTGSSVSTVGLR